MERRAFLGWLLSGAVALPLRGVTLHAQAVALSSDAVATLRGVASVALPSALGAAGHDKVVGDFVQWLSAYRPGAERSWGYGQPRKSATVPIDLSRYGRQLRDLEDRARTHGATLATLSETARRDLLIRAIDDEAVRDLPGTVNGQHVVTDFMAFFFGSSAAYDLAYRVRIARGTCRGLAGSAARPQPTTAGD